MNVRGQSLDHDSGSRCHVHLFDTGNPVAEIAGGGWFNSMALPADGWHMSPHALLLGLSVFAYTTARNRAAEVALASSDTTLTPDRVRGHPVQHEEIVHVTVEISRADP